jgi:hypothetical protein
MRLRNGRRIGRLGAANFDEDSAHARSMSKRVVALQVPRLTLSEPGGLLTAELRCGNELRSPRSGNSSGLSRRVAATTRAVLKIAFAAFVGG